MSFFTQLLGFLLDGNCIGQLYHAHPIFDMGQLYLRSGLLPSLIGVAHVAIQFPLYEAIKARMAQRQSCDASELHVSDLVRSLLPSMPCRIQRCQLQQTLRICHCCYA